MNDSKRTEAKEKSLKQKSFHRRLMRVLKSIPKIKIEKIKTYHGSGSGGGKGDIVTCLCYRLEATKSTYYLGYDLTKKTITQRFNKPQLKDKLILIEGEYYRIISKY